MAKLKNTNNFKLLSPKFPIVNETIIKELMNGSISDLDLFMIDSNEKIIIKLICKNLMKFYFCNKKEKISNIFNPLRNIFRLPNNELIDELTIGNFSIMDDDERTWFDLNLNNFSEINIGLIIMDSMVANENMVINNIDTTYFNVTPNIEKELIIKEFDSEKNMEINSKIMKYSNTVTFHQIKEFSIDKFKISELTKTCWLLMQNEKEIEITENNNETLNLNGNDYVIIRKKYRFIVKLTNAKIIIIEHHLNISINEFIELCCDSFEINKSDSDCVFIYHKNELMDNNLKLYDYFNLKKDEIDLEIKILKSLLLKIDDSKNILEYKLHFDSIK